MARLRCLALLAFAAAGRCSMRPEIDKITKFEEVIDVEEEEAFLEQLAA